MVKSYSRYEAGDRFAVICGNSNVAWIKKDKGAGYAVVGGLEDVLIWDIKTGVLRTRMSERDLLHEVVSVSIDPTGEVVASGYSDGSVRIWDAQSGALLSTFNGHKTAVSLLKFDRSGTRLASGSRDCSIVIWDLVGETGLFRFKGHKEQITGLEFVKKNNVVLNEDANDEGNINNNEDVDELIDERYLISTSKDGQIKIWDLEIQHCIETHIAHRGECWGMSIDTTNRANPIIITTGKEIKMWNLDIDADDGRKITEWGTLSKQVVEQRPVCVKFDKTGMYVGIANADKSVEIWRKRTGKEIKKAIARKQKRRREKGQEADDTLTEDKLDEVFVPHTIVRTSGKARGFDWAATAGGSSKLQIVVSLANNMIETYAVEANGENEKKTKKGVLAEYSRVYGVELPGHRTDVRALALSSDNRLVVSVANGAVKLWNVKTTSCLRTLECGYALCTSFLPGDSLILTGTKEGTLVLHDVASASVVCQVADAHNGAIWSLDVGSDGKTIVTASADKTVKFWQVKVSGEEDSEIDPFNGGVSKMKLRLKPTRTLELTDDVLSVKLSQDGRYVAASLLDSTVKVFFVDTLKFYLNLYGHKLPVLSLDMSHDSKLLISCSADKNIKIWGLDFGDCHKSIFAHQDSVMKVAFEPGTHHFFSVGKDKMVKYWDGDKFEQIQKLQGHHGEVWALAVANDASFVVSASHDKSIRIWELTDDPLFLEEEREKELEEMYESNLAISLDEDNVASRAGLDEDADHDTVERAGKQTVETLKAGEKLLEALDIGAKDLERIRTNSSEPRHIILKTLDVSGERYVLDVLQKIKASQLEDALLVFPFDRVVTLVEFLSIWAERRWNIPLICRVVAFIMRIYQKQLVANKMMRPTLEILGKRLRTCLQHEKDELGFNIAGLKYVKQSWEYSHQKEFVDTADYLEEQERQSKKRVFAA